MHYLKHPKFKHCLSNGLQVHKQNQKQKAVCPSLSGPLTHTCGGMLPQKKDFHSPYERLACAGQTRQVLSQTDLGGLRYPTCWYHLFKFWLDFHTVLSGSKRKLIPRLSKGHVQSERFQKKCLIYQMWVQGKLPKPTH